MTLRARVILHPIVQNPNTLLGEVSEGSIRTDKIPQSPATFQPIVHHRELRGGRTFGQNRRGRTVNFVPDQVVVSTITYIPDPTRKSNDGARVRARRRRPPTYSFLPSFAAGATADDARRDTKRVPPRRRARKVDAPLTQCSAPWAVLPWGQVAGATVTKPAGAIPGDIYLVYVDCETATLDAVIPGFNKIGQVGNSGGTENSSVSWFWRPYDGSEPSTWTITATGLQGSGINIIRGANPKVPPIGVFAFTGDGSAGPMVLPDAFLPSAPTRGFTRFNTFGGTFPTNANWTIVEGPGPGSNETWERVFNATGATGTQSWTYAGAHTGGAAGIVYLQTACAPDPTPATNAPLRRSRATRIISQRLFRQRNIDGPVSQVTIVATDVIGAGTTYLVREDENPWRLLPSKKFGEALYDSVLNAPATNAPFRQNQAVRILSQRLFRQRNIEAPPTQIVIVVDDCMPAAPIFNGGWEDEPRVQQPKRYNQALYEVTSTLDATPATNAPNRRNHALRLIAQRLFRQHITEVVPQQDPVFAADALRNKRYATRKRLQRTIDVPQIVATPGNLAPATANFQAQILVPQSFTPATNVQMRRSRATRLVAQRLFRQHNINAVAPSVGVNLVAATANFQAQILVIESDTPAVFDPIAVRRANRFTKARYIRGRSIETVPPQDILPIADVLRNDPRTTVVRRLQRTSDVPPPQVIIQVDDVLPGRTTYVTATIDKVTQPKRYNQALYDTGVTPTDPTPATNAPQRRSHALRIVAQRLFRQHTTEVVPPQDAVFAADALRNKRFATRRRYQVTITPVAPSVGVNLVPATANFQAQILFLQSVTPATNAPQRRSRATRLVAERWSRLRYTEVVPPQDQIFAADQLRARRFGLRRRYPVTINPVAPSVGVNLVPATANFQAQILSVESDSPAFFDFISVRRANRFTKPRYVRLRTAEVVPPQDYPVSADQLRNHPRTELRRRGTASQPVQSPATSINLNPCTANFQAQVLYCQSVTPATNAPQRRSRATRIVAQRLFRERYIEIPPPQDYPISPDQLRNDPRSELRRRFPVTINPVAPSVGVNLVPATANFQAQVLYCQNVTPATNAPQRRSRATRIVAQRLFRSHYTEVVPPQDYPISPDQLRNDPRSELRRRFPTVINKIAPDLYVNLAPCTANFQAQPLSCQIDWPGIWDKKRTYRKIRVAIRGSHITALPVVVTPGTLVPATANFQACILVPTYSTPPPPVRHPRRQTLIIPQKTAEPLMPQDQPIIPLVQRRRRNFQIVKMAVRGSIATHWPSTTAVDLAPATANFQAQILVPTLTITYTPVRRRRGFEGSDRVHARVAEPFFAQETPIPVDVKRRRGFQGINFVRGRVVNHLPSVTQIVLTPCTANFQAQVLTCQSVTPATNAPNRRSRAIRLVAQRLFRQRNVEFINDQTSPEPTAGQNQRRNRRPELSIRGAAVSVAPAVVTPGTLVPATAHFDACVLSPTYTTPPVANHRRRGFAGINFVRGRVINHLPSTTAVSLAPATANFQAQPLIASQTIVHGPKRPFKRFRPVPNRVLGTSTVQTPPTNVALVPATAHFQAQILVIAAQNQLQLTVATTHFQAQVLVLTSPLTKSLAPATAHFSAQPLTRTGGPVTYNLNPAVATFRAQPFLPPHHKIVAVGLDPLAQEIPLDPLAQDVPVDVLASEIKMDVLAQGISLDIQVEGVGIDPDTPIEVIDIT